MSGGACAGPATITATVDPARIQPGANVLLSWTGSNLASASCEVTNLTTGAQIDSATVSGCGLGNETTAVSGLTAQTTYRITCGSLLKEITVNLVPRFEEF